MPTAPTHFDHLLALLATERDAQRAQYESLRRELTLDQQALRGITLVDLEATGSRVGMAGRVLVDFESSPTGDDLPGRFRNGDVVSVRTRAAAATAEGVVAGRSRTCVTVAFNQPPPAWVDAGRVVLEMQVDAAAFALAERLCKRFRDATPRGEADTARKREWLLGERPPRFALRAPVPVEPRLGANPEQVEAIERALRAEELFLVHGPPGTGKTAVLGEVARHAVAAGQRVVATAASNAAVDHLLEVCLGAGLRAVRVGHPARVMERLRAHTLDEIVEGKGRAEGLYDAIDEAYELLGYARRQRAQGRSAQRHQLARTARWEARAMLDAARRREDAIERDVLERADVVCVTLTRLASLSLPWARVDLALLDEATQAIEPHAYEAVLRAGCVVMAGDHRQLPPTVISEEAARDGLALSLFERMVAAHGDAARVTLREQHRMHAQIMELPSRAFYDGALRAHPSVASHTLADLATGALDAPPVMFVDTAGRGWDESVAEGTESKQNEGEAAFVALRVGELLDAGVAPGDVAVITPYAAQALRVRDHLRKRGIAEAVEVDTVDAFQGREKEAVVLSLVRSNEEGEVGFVRDLRRLNVAITRARRHLCVVGDTATVGRHAFLAELVEHAHRCGGYRSVWGWPGAGEL